MTVRVSISYPPIETTKGTPLLSQNRQFQYFNEPTYIYPCVPASFAGTLGESHFRALGNPLRFFQIGIRSTSF